MTSTGQTTAFGRLIVVLDQLAPDAGAFAAALDWAWHLRRPLQAVFAPAWSQPPAELLRACTDACGRRRTPLELLPQEGSAPALGRQFLEPGDLLVFGHTLGPITKRNLLRTVRHYTQIALLVCPDTWVPLSRILFLDDGWHPIEYFAGVAATLCRSLGAAPVVLTVARSERAARLQQEAARKALAAHGVDADFDFVVASETRAAVAGVARWRRCQLLVCAGHGWPAWWRWLRSHVMERLVEELADTLAVLALSEAGLSQLGETVPPTREAAGGTLVPDLAAD